MAETMEFAREVVTLVKMRRDSVLAGDIISSDLVGIDGTEVVWPARYLGKGTRSRR